MCNVLFLIGNSDTLKKQAIEDIKTKRFKGLSLDVMIFYPEDTGGSHIVEFCRQTSFLGVARIAIIKDADKIKAEDRRILQSYVTNPSKQALLIFEFSDQKKIKSSGWQIKESATVHCSNPTGRLLFDWIKERFKKEGKQVDDNVLQTIIEISSGNIEGVLSIIERVCLYAGDRKDIKKEDVLRISEKTFEGDVFKMLHLCFLNDKKGAFRVLSDLIVSGEEPKKIMGTVSWHARVSLIVKILLEKKCNDIEDKLEEFKIKPGAYYLWKNIISETPLQKIKKYARLVEDIDYRIKTGRIPETVALEMLLANV